MGNRVFCIDKDEKKLEVLRRGKTPIYEPGLEALLETNLKEERLTFHPSLKGLPPCAAYFIAVGTPQSEDGSADLQHVLAVAEEIGRHLSAQAVIVNKSTVPVGTAEKVTATVREELQRRNVSIDFAVISNPEFLKEGDAVNDFMRPDRVIIGSDNQRASDLMREIYAPFMRNFDKLLFMAPRDAELTKYAANAMLATKISFMNEIANISEALSVDVENVRRGIGSDSRIGYAFIYPGCGYGGSCFPKDVVALIHMAESSSVNPRVLHAVEKRNDEQKRKLFEKVKGYFGDVRQRTFAIWGLSFKPGTDDIREAPSLVLIEALFQEGAAIRAYDPVAIPNAAKQLREMGIEGVTFTEHQYDALAGADALILVTEWKPFRHPDFAAMKRLMKKPLIFDGRNQYEPELMRKEGFEYVGIGRRS